VLFVSKRTPNHADGVRKARAGRVALAVNLRIMSSDDIDTIIANAFHG